MSGNLRWSGSSCNDRRAVLALLTSSFVVGELARYLIGTVSRDMARDVGFGDFSCYPLLDDDSGDGNLTQEERLCGALDSRDRCENATADQYSAAGNATRCCQYLRNGQGFQYLVLAGSTFVLVSTTSAIFIGILSDNFSRTRLLSVFTLLFSVSGVLTGFATKYWHLVVLRAGIAIGEAACRPTSGSLIPELFGPEARGTANGVFNWGVYWGFGLTFLLGNYLAPVLDVWGSGWRLAYVIGCAPGFLVSALLFMTPDRRKKRLQGPQPGPTAVREDLGQEARRTSGGDQRRAPPPTKRAYLRTVTSSLLQPTMVLLLLAGSFRQAGGLTWAINTQLYLDEHFPSYHLAGVWLASCSIFGGSIGVFSGGFLSDLAVEKLGLHSRLWALALSQVCATPLAVGVLMATPPYTFVCLLFYYVFAETWFSILFTVIVEIVPVEVRSVVIAVFIFLMDNIGGEVPLLVTPISDARSLQTALIVIWPGCVLLSGILFLVSGNLVKSSCQKKTLGAAKEDTTMIDRGHVGTTRRYLS